MGDAWFKKVSDIDIYIWFSALMAGTHRKLSTARQHARTHTAPEKQERLGLKEEQHTEKERAS